MPSLAHESLVEFFRTVPELVPKLLRDLLGVEVGPYVKVRTDSASLPEPKPVEHHADLVVRLEDEHGKASLGVVLEVQLKAKPDKLYSWPVYGVCLRARLKCRCVVLVVTPNEDVAEWASAPIDLGGESIFQPLVIGPKQIPPVRDPGPPPEVCVLSAMVHGQRETDTAVQVAVVAASAIARFDPDLRALCYDLIVAYLSEDARKVFLMLPQGYQFQSEPMRTSFAKGKAEGEARALLAIFEARGMPVSEELREKILSCTDVAVLDKWVARAVTAQSAAEAVSD